MMPAVRKLRRASKPLVLSLLRGSHPLRRAYAALDRWNFLAKDDAGRAMDIEILKARFAGANRMPFTVWVPAAGYMRIDEFDLIGALIYYFRIWEPSVTRLLAEELRPGDVFVDVGANIGYYALTAANRVGPSGRVVAVEASPTIFGRLRANVALNRHSNVEMILAAAMARQGKAEIFLGPDNNLGQSSVFPTERHRREATVRAAPLDDLVPRRLWSRVRGIKIDVEGAEEKVLAGAQGLLAALPADAFLVIEVTRSEDDPERSARVVEHLASSFALSVLEVDYDVEHYRAAGQVAGTRPFTPDLLATRQFDLLCTKRR